MIGPRTAFVVFTAAFAITVAFAIVTTSRYLAAMHSKSPRPIASVQHALI
jgi:hypothetical protein